MVAGGGEVAQGYDFTKRATRFESSFADAGGDSAKGAVPITVLPDKVCGAGVGGWMIFGVWWWWWWCCGGVVVVIVVVGGDGGGVAMVLLLSLPVVPTHSVCVPHFIPS